LNLIIYFFIHIHIGIAALRFEPLKDVILNAINFKFNPIRNCKVDQILINATTIKN